MSGRDMSDSGKQLLEFGPFCIDAEQRLLLRDEQPIPLSPKAFDQQYGT